MKLRESEASMSANDSAWEEIFSKLQLIETLKSQDYVVIDSSFINQTRESRLMAKIDQESDLPEIFQNRGLSLLAISRGSYAIGNFKLFFPLPEYTELTINKPVKKDYTTLESLSKSLVNSESRLINLLYSSGIFADFVGEEVTPTISGRMTTGAFDAEIQCADKNINISFNRPQIEIDGGFEGKNYVHIVEAKNVVTSNFNLRQLYFPLVHLASKVQKQIKTYFIDTDEVFVRIQEIIFPNLNVMKAELGKSAIYKLHDFKIEGGTMFDELPPIILDPFPQADDFNKVIDLVNYLENNDVQASEIADEFEFTLRQADYYFNAAKALGLATSYKRSDGANMKCLTKLGSEICKLDSIEQQSFYTLRLKEIGAVKKTLKFWLTEGSKPSKSEVAQFLENDPAGKSLSRTTLERRATTVISWAAWVKART